MNKNRDTLIAYLQMKVGEEDWHGVADAAMDLRELEARLAPPGITLATGCCPGVWYVGCSIVRCSLPLGHDGGCLA
jgi:hypothetical protein